MLEVRGQPLIPSSRRKAKNVTKGANQDGYVNFHNRTQFSHLGIKASILQAEKNFEEFICTPSTVQNVQFPFPQEYIGK